MSNNLDNNRPRQIEGRFGQQLHLEDNNAVNTRVSIAIDFGTSNCAVGYSCDTTKDDVQVISEWHDGVPTHGKIPTAILFDEHQKFVAFGNRAIDTYRDFVLDKENEKFYFFENFKMVLYDDENLSKDKMLVDRFGKEMPAIDVFTGAIKYIREFVLQEMEKRGTKNLTEHEINWVITVPAIWSNAAKQFMRQAAQSANCSFRNIIIALEPEAASIYCQSQPNAAFQKLLSSDTKYLVIDNGGGTVDVTVHQLDGRDCIKEIYRVSGGNMGGSEVNKLFEEFLVKLFSKDNIEHIKRNYHNEWMRIVHDFEKAKKRIEATYQEGTISIGTSELCPWNHDHFNNIDVDVRQGVQLKKGGRLIIPKAIIKGMVSNVAIDIKDHITNILKEVNLESLNAVLMVGGFSNSNIIFEEMKKLVRGRVPLIVPENTELCVVMGAVLFGWKTDVIRTRKSRLTYGIGVTRTFKDGHHDEARSYIDQSGKKKCKDCFRTLVTINNDISLNQKVEVITYHKKHGDIDYSKISLFAAKKTDVMYQDEDGVEMIGKITVPFTEESRGKQITTSIYFGTTEITLKVKDETTGTTYDGKFDFLFENKAKFLQ